MSLSTQTNRTDHTENGVTTVFPFDFKIFSEADLVVLSVDQFTDVETQLTLGVDYTVSGVNADAGSITKTAGTSGDGLVIKRIVPLNQPTVLRNQSDFFPATHEKAFDRIVMQNQQQQEELDRAVKFSPTSTSRGVMPEPVPGYSVGFDANGDLAAVPNTGADQTLAWTAADAVVAADAATATALVRSDLASTATGEGAEMVGYLAPYTGAVARTQAGKNSEAVSAEDYGAVGDGVTNDTTAIQAALTNAKWVRLTAGKTYMVAGLAPVSGSGLVCSVGRAILGLHSSGNTLLTVAVPNFTLSGVDLVGPSVASYADHLLTIGTKTGLSFNDASIKDCTVENCDISGFDKYGVYVGQTNSASAYYKCIVFQNVNSFKNYQNWFLDSNGEYCDLLGCHGHDGFIGIQVMGGNNKMVGCNFDRNYRCCYLVNGTNSHHGGFYGCSFNHAQDNGYGLHATGVVYGEMFVGCAFWYGNIYLNSCNGITITQGQLANITVTVVGGNLNWIKDNWTYGTVTKAFSGFWQTIWRNNRSVYQDSSQDNQWPDVYIEANLSAAAQWASVGGAQFTGFNTVVQALRHHVSDPSNTYASAAGLIGVSGTYDWDIILNATPHAGAIAGPVTLTLNIYANNTYAVVDMSYNATCDFPAAGGGARSLVLRTARWCRYGQAWKLFIKTPDTNGIDVVIADSKLIVRGNAP